MSENKIIAIRYDTNHYVYDKSHNDYYVGTEAIELPTVEELRQMAINWALGNKNATVSLKNSYVKRNPKDNFVKKVGKELALARLEKSTPLQLDLHKIYFDPSQNFNLVFSFEGWTFGLTNTKVIFMGFGE